MFSSTSPNPLYLFGLVGYFLVVAVLLPFVYVSVSFSSLYVCLKKAKKEFHLIAEFLFFLSFFALLLVGTSAEHQSSV